MACSRVRYIDIASLPRAWGARMPAVAPMPPPACQVVALSCESSVSSSFTSRSGCIRTYPHTSACVVVCVYGWVGVGGWVRERARERKKGREGEREKSVQATEYLFVVKPHTHTQRLTHSLSRTNTDTHTHTYTTHKRMPHATRMRTHMHANTQNMRKWQSNTRQEKEKQRKNTIQYDIYNAILIRKQKNGKKCNTSVSGVRSKGLCKSSSLKKAIRYTSTAICAGGRAWSAVHSLAASL